MPGSNLDISKTSTSTELTHSNPTDVEFRPMNQKARTDHQLRGQHRTRNVRVRSRLSWEYRNCTRLWSIARESASCLKTIEGLHLAITEMKTGLAYRL